MRMNPDQYFGVVPYQENGLVHDYSMHILIVGIVAGIALGIGLALMSRKR